MGVGAGGKGMIIFANGKHMVSLPLVNAPVLGRPRFVSPPPAATHASAPLQVLYHIVQRPNRSRLSVPWLAGADVFDRLCRTCYARKAPCLPAVPEGWAVCCDFVVVAMSRRQIRGSLRVALPPTLA